MEALFLAFTKICISLSLVLLLASFTNFVFQKFFTHQSKILLKFNFCLFCLALLLPLLPSVASESFRFEAPLKVWSSESFKKGQWNDGLRPVLAVNAKSNFNVETQKAPLAILGIVSIFVFVWLWQFQKLQKLIGQSQIWKKRKHLQINLSQKITAPISFRKGNTSFILLPYWILERRDILHLSLRHEFCHIRRGDLWTAQFLSLMKFIFLWNPIFLIWERQIQNLQEMACDETVVGRYRINRQVYSRCLFEVANRSRCLSQTLAGTPGVLAFGNGEHLLRRIKVMIQKQKQSSKWAAFGILAIGFFLAITGAWAAKNIVQDSRITMEEAVKLAQSSSENGEIPISMNKAVLDQMNRYVATPDGKKFFKASIQRMSEIEEILKTKSREHSTPWELVALPIVESGYQNLDASHNKNGSAGIWQFIKSTAITFGLKVTKQKDERLDYDKATDAALRYLKANHIEFQDWSLAILAYNAGEKRIQNGIDKTGSRDAFKLVEAGFGGDPNYLAKVMAAVIIYKNQHLLN